MIIAMTLAACGPIDISDDEKEECDECSDSGVTDSGSSDSGDADADTDSDSDTDVDSDTDSGVDSGTDSGDPPDADGDGFNAEPDCDDSDATINPGASEVCDSADNDCDGAIDEGDVCEEEDEEYDLTLTVGTPGGAQVGTMFVHAEFLEDVGDAYGSWTWSGRYAWTNGEELEFNPGLVEGVRFNATYCSDETEDESDSSCSNWLAYGSTSSEAHLTAAASVVYFDVSYDVDTTTFCWDGDGNGSEETCGSSAISEFD